MNKFLQKIGNIFIEVNFFVYTRLPPLLVYVIGYYFVVIIFINLNEDTTSITNSAFAILASFSALSFSCARLIEGDPDTRDRFSYAGERLLHAAIMAITASIIKYAFLSLQKSIVVPSLLLSIVAIITGSFVCILFMYSLGSAHCGIVVLNKLLWERFNRSPDWNNLL